MNVLRLLVGTLGGYFITSLFTITLGYILPFENKVEAILTSSLISFAIWAFFILYAFKIKSIKSLLLQFISIAILLCFINYYLT